jgi:uncharacterized protein involved in type VI secretion and phage assembly
MSSQHRANGILIGIVSSLDDPEHLGRITVQYPYLGNQESDQARLATVMAGNGFGTYFLPDVGDEVLVALEQNDPRRAYILGGLWSQPDPPPKDVGKATDNHVKLIKTRCGQMIVLDDSPGKEKIVLIDKDGKRKVVIDSGSQKIEVLCDQGNVDIKAPNGDLTIEARSITIKATTDLNLTGGTVTTVKGQTVKIN